MGIAFGKVVGSESRTNRDGTGNKLMLQVEISSPDDIQSAQFMDQAGQMTNPPINSTVLIAGIGEAFKVAFAADDGIVPSVGVGEQKLYSSDVGTIMGFINLLVDGTIEINGNADFAVRYNALETAFNQLQTDFDTHIHPVTTAPGSTGVPTAPSTADITGAKVDEVKLP